MADELRQTSAQAPEHPSADVPTLGLRTGRTMLWGQISKSLEALLTLAVAVAAVRALNPNAFGLYSLLTYLAGSASVLVPLVMVEAAGALLPRVADPRKRVSLMAFVALLRIAYALAAATVLLIVWESFRGVIGLDAISYRVFAIAVVYWLSQDLLNSVSAFFLIEFDLRPVALWRPIGQAVSLLIILFVAATEDRWSSGVGEVLLAVAVGFLVTLGGLLWNLRRYGIPSAPPPVEARAVHRLTRTTWAIGMLTFALGTQVDVLLIGAITGSPREVAFYVTAVGVVARAQSLLLYGWLAPIVPALSRAELGSGRHGFARVWELFAQLWLFVALPINVLLLVVAHPLLEALFGPEYRSAGGLLVWTAMFNILFALVGGTLGTSALWALDRQGTVTAIKAVTAVANIGLAVVLIHEYLALGAVIATGVTLVLTGAVETAVAARMGGVRYPFGFALRTAAASVAAAGPALLIRPDGALGVVVAVVLGALAFAAAAFALRPFSREDIKVLEGLSPRLARSPLRLLARS
jgi:O-antigen/teichoic acid export membrane protein